MTRCAVWILGCTTVLSSGCDLMIPGVTCGGAGGDGCAADQYCAFAEGSCGANDAGGVCLPRPIGCPRNLDPVCGCDGMTYGNTCEAAAAGVSVASSGMCVPGGEVCGGIAGVPCSRRDQFCKMATGECCCDRQGTCTDIPDFCTEQFDPVCGCDGKTYGNECLAEQAGASVDHPGECLEPGMCLSDDDCTTAFEVCIFDPGSCGRDGRAGRCEDPRLIDCSAEDIPVCGCDGMTYLNDCLALVNGISVETEGTCP